MHRRVAPDPQQLPAAVHLLARPSDPWWWSATARADHVAAVLELAERLGAPVFTTFKAKGLVGDDHPLGAGVLGRSGTPVASWLMNESDLVIALGTSFSNHTGIADYKPIIQVDDDPAAIARFHPVTCGLLGDVGLTLRMLCDALPDELAAVDQRSDIEHRWELWREEKARRLLDDRGAGVRPSRCSRR